MRRPLRREFRIAALFCLLLATLSLSSTPKAALGASALPGEALPEDGETFGPTRAAAAALNPDDARGPARTTLPESSAMLAPPTTDEEALEYVREVWNITDLTDETIKEFFSDRYEGIPYKDWISFFLEVPDILIPLRDGDYQEASDEAVRVASTGLFNIGLSNVGLGGVAAIAGLGVLPIEYGISNFAEAVYSDAFEAQLDLYFQARARSDYETILNAAPFELIEAEGNPVYKEGRGWLFRTGSANAVPGFTPEQFLQYAEAEWQARQREQNYESDNAQVKEEFLEAVEGGGDPPPGEQIDVQIDVSGLDGYETVPRQITFDGSASGGPEEIVSYEWSFDDGSTATGETVSHVFYEAGRYDLQLTVTDAEGTQSQATRSVFLSAPTFAVTPQDLYAHTFEAAASSSITGYEWSFGDGATASGRVVEHTYGLDGNYEVTLTLSYESGGEATVTQSVYAGPRPVEVGGTVTGEHMWPAIYGPYVVDYMTVEEGATLTVEPGVVVKFEEEETEMHIRGTLVAEGTAQDSIVFTSIKDDTYGGDTNGDGDETSPSDDDWEELEFEPGSEGSISHAVFLYGGSYYTNYYGRRDGHAMVYVEGASPTITNSRFAGGETEGIEVAAGEENGEEAAPLIEGNVFTNNGGAGVHAEDASGTIRGNVFEGNSEGVEVRGASLPDLGTASDYGRNIFRNNTDYAVRNESSETVQAIGNFWGTADAAAIDDRIYDDDEDSGSGPVVFDPYLNEPPADDDPPAVPAGLAATAREAEVMLSWDANAEDDLSAYRLYRATRPQPTTLLTTIEAETTTYTDEDVAEGATYYYRLTAVDDADNESGFSDEVSVSLDSPGIPYEITWRFGSGSETSDYRLVALPGADDVPLPDALGGVAEADWQAFRQSDGGSGLTAYRDDPESFQFGPGRGFWVIATSDLTREATAEAVEIGEDGTYALDLHDGWNIISNPFERDLSWSAVQEASSASQAIHAFTEGSYAQTGTFASAAGGESYYFYNQEGLDRLVLPYASEASSAPARLASEDGGSKASRVAEAAWTLALTAERRVASERDAEQRVYATVRAGAAAGAKAGFDARDQFAPPGRFEAVSLGLRPPSDSLAGAELAAEYRPPAADGDEGHRFPLVLRSAPGEEVTLHAEGAARLAGGRRALLIREATGEHFRLSDEAVRFTPEAAEERLVLVVGSAAFTEAAAQDAAPPAPTLIGAYPNPFRDRATVAYAVSEPSRVRLTVYDVLGRRVRTLVDETQTVGRKKAVLQARSLSSGVYLFRLHVGDYVETGRLVLVR